MDKSEVSEEAFAKNIINVISRSISRAELIKDVNDDFMEEMDKAMAEDQAETDLKMLQTEIFNSYQYVLISTLTNMMNDLLTIAETMFVMFAATSDIDHDQFQAVMNKEWNRRKENKDQPD